MRALDPGTIGNVADGTRLEVAESVVGVDHIATVVHIDGGTDEETDEELRARVLRRIRQPPMGGAAYDYEAWALAVPGVTRAWAASEMGIGTVTVRFMMDNLRADNDGFPTADDIAVVSAYINSKRPVTVKDCFVLSPLRQPIDFDIVNLVPDTPAVRGAIEASIEDMLYFYGAPGQTIFAAWKYAAIMAAAGVISFDMTTTADDVMPSPGHIGVLGDLYFTTTIPVTASASKAIIKSSHG